MTFEQLLNNEKFVAEFENCNTLAEGAELMKAYGVDADEAQLKELAAELQEDGEMNEDQLDAVAGGARIFAGIRATFVKQQVQCGNTTVRRYGIRLTTLFRQS